ncbi:MAG: hypothetical protein IIA44_14365, partial [Acidobacteria bacterium]|nr:hypothetical protein [Acidobacteriota bacterium]
DWFVNLGARADDTQQEKAQKTTLVVIVGVTTPIVLLWSVVYGYLGLPQAAVIPLIYAVVSTAGLVLVARRKRTDFLRSSQMVMFLALPFLLQ